MRKLLLALLILTLAVPVMAAGWTKTALLTGGVVTDNTLSAAIALPSAGVVFGGASKYVSLYVPTITSSTVQVYGSVDGTNFYPIHGISNATNMVAELSAAGTGGFTMTFPSIDFRVFTHLKIYCATEQEADRTFTFMGHP